MDEKTPLMLACEAGDEEGVERILKELGDTVSDNINHQDIYGNTALSYALRNGHEKVTVRLIDHGADVKFAQIDGRTPLMEAVRNGLHVVVERILKELGDTVSDHINYQDMRGRTAFRYAFYTSRLGSERDIVRLIEHGADVMLGYQFDFYAPLERAIDRHLDVVAKRIIQEASQDYINTFVTPFRAYTGESFLSYAIWGKSIDIALCLIDHGADVKLPRRRGRTPLMDAAYRGLYVVVERILKELGDTVIDHINLKDKIGQTALSYACSEEYVDIVRLLLQYGADPRISWNPDLMLGDRFQSIMKRAMECSREDHEPE